MPLTSPIAHRRSPARRWSSTGIPCGIGRRCPPSRGRYRRRADAGRWPRAAGRRAGRRPPSNSQDVLIARPAARRWRASPSISSIPSRRSASPSAWPSGAASRGSTRSAPSTSTASPPSRRTTCASSTPAAPPPSTSRRRGTAFMLVASRVPQTPSSSRSPGIGGTNGSEPVATTTCSAVWRTPSTSTTPVPGQASVPRSRSMPRSGQPALLARVGVVRDHEIPPGQRGLDVHLGSAAGVARTVHRLARAQQRLRRNAGPVGALAADQLPLHDCDMQPARGERRSAMLARARRRRKRSRRSQWPSSSLLPSVAAPLHQNCPLAQDPNRLGARHRSTGPDARTPPASSPGGVLSPRGRLR